MMCRLGYDIKSASICETPTAARKDKTPFPQIFEV